MPTQSLPWPELRWDDWKDTAATLHMWTQIVGKTRLELAPLQNHWWNVPLYLSARGLTTSAMPYRGEMLEIEFDFVSHDLRFRMSTGSILSVPLRPQSVASFYAEYQRCLATLGVDVTINAVPVEIADPIPFAEDELHHSYDPVYAHRFWRILSSVDLLFTRFSSRFIGKKSPVHFFWGSFDLAVSRFCGRLAPPRDGADAITREAYSHEVISAGFWPGNGGFRHRSLLLLHSTHASRSRPATSTTRSSLLRSEIGRIPPPLRRRTLICIPRRRHHAIPSKHLRSRR